MVHPLSETFGVNRQKYNTGKYTVKFTRILGIWPRKIYLQWALSGVKHATGFVFKLEDSGSPGGPWEEVTPDLTDTFYCIDESWTAHHDRTTGGMHALREVHYYRLTVTHPDEGTISIIDHVNTGTADQRREGMIRKLRRDAMVALRKGNGTEVAILKRKWWGEPCTCRSATGLVTRSHCALCKGTGIVTGYWNPVYTFGSRSESGPDSQTASPGTVEVRKLQSIIPYYPEVIPGDILVFLRDNLRFIVEGNTYTSLQTQVVHQELIISQIAPTSVECNIPVDPWVDQGWY